MSAAAPFIAAANAAAVALGANLATLQADIATTGDIDNATTAQLALLTADAAVAQASAEQALAAHESVFGTIQTSSLASGANPAAAVNAVLLMMNATAGMALAQDTANRMARIGKTIAAVGT